MTMCERCPTSKCPNCNRPAATDYVDYDSDKDRTKCYEWYLRSRCGLSCRGDIEECNSHKVNWPKYAWTLEDRLLTKDQEIAHLKKVLSRHHADIRKT